MSEFVTKQIVATQVVAQVLVTKLREHAEEGQGMAEYGRARPGRLVIPSRGAGAQGQMRAKGRMLRGRDR